MLKLSIFVVSTVMSYLFWWIADLLKADFYLAFMISGVGAIFGCWLGWKIHKTYFN